MLSGAEWKSCFKETPLFLLGCNMDESAVMTAYNAANGG